jgi:glutaredoxin
MKNLRIYLATQIGCEPCKVTKQVLGTKVASVPVYEVDLSLNPERRNKMGVTSTPTIFIVEVTDENENGILEEIEEKHLYHQSGMIADATNLKKIIRHLKRGNNVVTPID